MLVLFFLHERERARERTRERKPSKLTLLHETFTPILRLISVIDYEKLDVYVLALRFVGNTLHLREVVQKGNGDLIEQFRRASFSIVLNIAEGAGKSKQGDKQRFYAIARGSAMECCAILDLFHLLKIIEEEELRGNKALLTRVVSMLSVMCFGRGD